MTHREPFPGATLSSNGIPLAARADAAGLRPSPGRTVFQFTASMQFYPAIRKWNWLIKVPEALNGLSGDGYDTGDEAWATLFAKLRELNPLSK